ncbi:MAG: Na-translocating system protein MpsB, partial [Bryobacterales bacterium]|nr:Na-translocating system protein MpsB [Bryobacterales bacterium]
DSDADGGILERIMTAPLIVGEWINMEYYFSTADPWVYGSGSKVIHNVVGGIGVMLGSQSDLQGGLPVQGVIDGPRRYHEPMRLLAVIDAPAARIAAIIAKHEILQTLFHNQWVNLLAFDADRNEFQRYRVDATWDRSAAKVAA